MSNTETAPPRRDWILVYVREGDPAYWVAADGELRVPSDVPPSEEWAPEMLDSSDSLDYHASRDQAPDHLV